MTTAEFRITMASGEKIAAIFFGCLVYLLGAMSRVAVPGMVFAVSRVKR